MEHCFKGDCLPSGTTPAQRAVPKHCLDRNSHVHFPGNKTPTPKVNYARGNKARGVNIQTLSRRWKIMQAFTLFLLLLNTLSGQSITRSSQIPPLYTTTSPTWINHWPAVPSFTISKSSLFKISHFDTEKDVDSRIKICTDNY